MKKVIITVFLLLPLFAKAQIIVEHPDINCWTTRAIIVGVLWWLVFLFFTIPVPIITWIIADKNKKSFTSFFKSVIFLFWLIGIIVIWIFLVSFFLYSIYTGGLVCS